VQKRDQKPVLGKWDYQYTNIKYQKGFT